MGCCFEPQPRVTLCSGLAKNAGAVSLPTHTMVLPLPVMNTALKSLPPASISCCFSAASSGKLHID